MTALSTATATRTPLRQEIDDLLADNPDLVRKVQGLYSLVGWGVSYWRGRPVMKEATVYYNGKPVEDEAASQPHWQLMPRPWQDRFASLEAGVRNLVNFYSVPARMFTEMGAAADEEDDTSGKARTEGRRGLHGVRLVLSFKLEEFWARMGDMMAAMQDLADKFCSSSGREAINTHLQLRYPDADAYADACRLVPDAEHLRSKFGVFRAYIPNCVSAEAASDAASFAGRLAGDSATAQAASNLENAIRAPRKQLSLAARALQGQLVDIDHDGYVMANERRRLQGRSLRAFWNATEAFENFAELAEPELADAVARARGRLLSLGVGQIDDSPAARKLNSSASDREAEELGLLLADVVQKAENEDGMIRAVQRVCDRLLSKE